MPSARAPTPSDLYSLLSSAVAAATTTTAQSPSSNSPSKTPSSTKPALFPTNITTPADKQSFLTTQREKIAVLMRALDREQRDLDLAYGNAPPSSEVEADIERRMKDLSDSDGVEMRKNKSNNSFQNIEREELEEDGGDKEQGGGVPPPEKTKRQAVPNTSGRATSGSWNPTTWFSSAAGTATGTEDDGGVGGGVAKEVREAVQGMSSSIDR